MPDLTLGELDRDGAIQQAADRVLGGSRADLLRRATVGGAALLGVLSLPSTGSAATANDVDILNYALLLEHLQANFKGTTENQTKFLKTAVAFEDLAVAAYKAQAPRLDSKEILAVAVSIHSVEARHAAWMRRLFGIVPAAAAFDEALSKPEVTRIVASTGFITSSGTTERQGEPRFTG